MYIYLPIAEMAIQAEHVLLVSMFVGFLSGALGIGGGFLTTPFLIFLGIPPSIAVGTQTAQLIASSTAGVLGHLKRGAVDTKIGYLMLVGGFIGSFLGIFLFSMFEKMGEIEYIISFLYIILLGGIGLSMLVEIIRSMFVNQNTFKKQFNASQGQAWAMWLPFKTRFPRSKLYVSSLLPFTVGLVGGVLASLLGIGGGFLLVPAMIYILGMPASLVAGTSLFQMIFTMSFAVIMHSYHSQTVDFMLAAILIVGGVIGAQIGASISRYLSGKVSRITLMLIVLSVVTKLCCDLLFEPEELYVTVRALGE